MEDSDRRRFESIYSLMQAAQNSFNERRIYEWKFNLSIWTAFAIVIAGLLQPIKQGETFPLDYRAIIGSVVLGALIIAIHIYWSHCCSRANAIDKKIAIHYSNELKRIISLQFPTELELFISNLPKNIGWTQWSQLSQITITSLLVICIICLIFVRSGNVIHY